MKQVIIVGGGIAGMQTAITLAELGVKCVIVEKGPELGGHLRGWHALFPSFTPAHEVLDPLLEKVEASGAQVILNQEVTSIDDRSVTLADGTKIAGDGVMICSGFELFDARIKEEYGYGIYDNVFTTADLEKMFNDGKVTMKSGADPRKIALLHCVGSRDEKANQRHCSRVCCVTAVKQAIELRKMFPEVEVYNFYMDIRMFGPGWEELYRIAQQDYNVHFVRGRISEASQTLDKRIQIKAEDTLVGRPLRMSVDMLVLVAGMTAAPSNFKLVQHPAVDLYPSGFFQPRDLFQGNIFSASPAIFYAGTATAPKSVGETLNEATAAAHELAKSLR